MNVLDLFSGIGGFSLGLERAGMRTVAFCEIDPYCRAVLARHWPSVPCYDDVTTLTAARLAADGIIETVGDTAGSGSFPFTQAGIHRGKEGAGPRDAQPQRRGVDVIAGGFPCQDISAAGKGAGITGARSGLWSAYARIIGEIRPRYVIVENVAALLGRGIERVLGDLATLGYDSEWHCIPASAIGAPHRRDRVWIIAYPQHTDADSERPHRTPQHVNGNAEFCDQQVGVAGQVCQDVADADKPRLERWISESLRECADERVAWANGAYAADYAQNGAGTGWGISARAWWIEPDVGRVAHGVQNRVHRLRALGNAVVPQIPEIIGRAIIMNHMEDQWTPPPPMSS